jgi:AhpD family alkylhydroperoxidase
MDRTFPLILDNPVRRITIAGQHAHAHNQGESLMEKSTYPAATKELAKQRAELAPEMLAAFKAFSAKVFADGALPSKTKQLIAVAVAHVTQCPYCIRGHTELALKVGATEKEIMEAIWVASEMRAGAAYAHSLLALDTMNEFRSRSAE